jgi:hypothetical protein
MVQTACEAESAAAVGIRTQFMSRHVNLVYMINLKPVSREGGLRVSLRRCQATARAPQTLGRSGAGTACTQSS